MSDFAEYSDILYDAFVKHSKKQDIVFKKKEIYDSVIVSSRRNPVSTLFIGFTPLIYSATTDEINVSCVSPAAVSEIAQHTNKKVNVIEYKDLENFSKQFDFVFVLNEFFTYASSEEHQVAKIELVCDLATGLVVTTLRDYKNQDYKSREFSTPASVRNEKDTTVYLEFHDIDFRNKLEWNTTVYELQTQTPTAHGPFARRAMFFKQLAKLSKDAGASDFSVHKNIMYKSLIRKNYEHVITITIG